MSVEFVTKNDLQDLRTQLIKDIKALLSENKGLSERPLQGFKTKDVRKILGCSVNKLVSLRGARKIRWKKIGGTVFYNPDDIKCLLDEGF